MRSLFGPIALSEHNLPWALEKKLVRLTLQNTSETKSILSLSRAEVKREKAAAKFGRLLESIQLEIAGTEEAGVLLEKARIILQEERPNKYLAELGWLIMFREESAP